MEITSLEQQDNSVHYNVVCRNGVEQVTQRLTPFSSTHCTLGVGQASHGHGHHETEVFVMLSGSGMVRAQDQTGEVKTGDMIAFSPFERHEIINTGSDELRYLSVVWADSTAIADAARPRDKRMVILQSTPPTPNGDLHLGHLSGPFIAVDAMRRYYLMRGNHAAHLSGRDDHQSYVLKKAIDLDKSPTAVANEYSDRMVRTFNAAGVGIDYYSEPARSPWHKKMTQEVFLDLIERGLIEEREGEALFCAETGTYLHEALVAGNCPHCGAGSDGNNCEQCGRPNSVVDLLNPRSKLSKSGAVERRTVKRMYFKLSRFRERLFNYHCNTAKSNRASAYCAEVLTGALDDICVSHITNWGTEIPLPGYENQKIFAYFEVAIGYLAAAQGYAAKEGENDKDKWRALYNPSASRVIHFLGFDNCFTHLILGPAIYMAMGVEQGLPEAYVLNELLYLNGEKFSTSRNHLILGIDLLKFVSTDCARYALAAIRPEESVGNFTLDYLRSAVDGVLVDGWEQWIDDVLASLCTDFAGQVPSSGAWTGEHRAFYEELRNTIRTAQCHYEPEAFSLRLICQAANDLVVRARREFDNQRHFRRHPSSRDYWRTTVALQLSAMKCLSQIVQPVMPEFATAFRQHLEGDQAQCAWADEPEFVTPGRLLHEKTGQFFTRLPSDIGQLEKR